MDSSPWHVLHLLTNHEKRVAQHLAARSVEHYLPLYTERVKWTDRTVVAERPLFPGYIFVRSLFRNRITVISTPGVLRMLGDKDSDLVSCEELYKIREGLSTGLLLRPHPEVSVGKRVRVRSGIFTGSTGIVTELRRQCKVIISLSAIHQSFSLEVEIGELELVCKPIPKPGLKPFQAFGH